MREWFHGGNLALKIQILTSLCQEMGGAAVTRRTLIDFFSIDNQIIVHNYIRYENYEKDFAAFCRTVGIRDYNLPHLNNTAGTSLKGRDYYAKYYNEQTYEFVTRVFKEDLKHFNYSF